eukprot:c91_g1_i2.p1 GENE.c91_g1_i2~~c91_g1_i2.p1  ORF type:complete len:124 (+),score=25.85 c91_g1_i2:169-540(+)
MLQANSTRKREQNKLTICFCELRSSNKHDRNFIASFNYARQFRRIHNVAAVKEVRSSLQQYGFKAFEIASIVNLCPRDPEEAKRIIPSLESYTDEELREALQELDVIVESHSKKDLENEIKFS